jgi:hypothetical protein
MFESYIVTNPGDKCAHCRKPALPGNPLIELVDSRQRREDSSCVAFHALTCWPKAITGANQSIADYQQLRSAEKIREAIQP